MKKIKIRLRLHIFLAFLIVFLIAFAIILLAFNFVVQTYIRDNATNKIRQSIAAAIELSGKDKSSEPVIVQQYSSDADLIIHRIIQPLTSNSEVYAALLNTNYGIEYPTSSDSIRERAMVNIIAAKMEKEEISLSSSSIRNLRIDEDTEYYVSCVPISVKIQGNYAPTTPRYLLLYFDASPLLLFAKGVNNILLIIMFVALFLSMLASVVVSSSIIQSTKKLTAFAGKIGSGDFKPEKFDFLDKELDILAADMNVMADKLDQADREQKTFFQNASHELRTPLMSIQGYAEGIRYKVFDDVESASDIIISESQRLTGMVENLLTISRMDTAAAGRQDIPKHIIDLRELLESVAEKMRGSALHAQKSISVRFSEKELHVLANDNDLFRAFENILSNCIRYAKSCVDISTDLVAPDRVQITIKDDGTGISTDLLPHVFDRFARGDGGKHGIGLALVKAIITDHKGTVTASNRTDGVTGAVFTVTLAAVAPDENRTFRNER